MLPRGMARLLLFALLVLSLSCLCAAQQPQRFDFPSVGPYVVLRADFHMHTIHSDGKLTSRERVEESKRRGYDVIAITDHGKVEAYRPAKMVGDQIGVLVIRGHETGMAGKEHYVVIGVDDTYVPKDSHRWSENRGDKTVFYQDEMKNVAAHGGIIIWAHPHVGLREPTIWGARQGIIKGLELKNDVVGDGWNTEKSHGTSWYPFAFDWAMQYDLAVLACTDAHGSRLDNPATTLVFATERTRQGVIDAIAARRTVAMFDGMLWGRKEMLSALMDSMVKGKFTDGKLSLANLGPIALSAEIGDRTFEIAPYGQAEVDAGSAPVTVKWTNVWYGLKDNLTTSYAR